MSYLKSTFLFLAVLGCASILFSSVPAQAEEEFPSKEIELIITVDPGSAADVFARVWAKATEEATGWTIVCNNKPGGGHARGIGYVLGQPADGHTIFGQTATLPFHLAAGKIPYAADKIKPVVAGTADPLMFIVPSESPADTLEEFVEYAKDREDKGSPVKIGGVSVTAIFHALTYKFAQMADFDYNWVPYTGGSPTTLDLLANNIDASTISSGNVRDHLVAGDLKVLAVYLPERDDQFDETPTFKELGYDLVDVHFRGLFTDADVSRERVQIIAEGFKKGTQTKRWQDYLEDHQQTPNLMMPDEFQAEYSRKLNIAKEFVDEMEGEQFGE